MLPSATKDFGPYIYEDPGQRGGDHFYGKLWSGPGKPDEAGSPDGGQGSAYATYFMDDDVQLPDIGQAAVGSFVNSTYLPTIDTPQNKAFLERWHKKFKDTNHPWPAAQSRVFLQRGDVLLRSGQESKIL